MTFHPSLRKPFGLLSASLLFVGTSSAIAQTVLDGDSIQIQSKRQLEIKREIRLDQTAVLTLVGNARAKTFTEAGLCDTLLTLHITNTDGTDNTELCGADRAFVTTDSQLGLFASASCVRLLPPGNYVLTATHQVNNAARVTTSMDYVLAEFAPVQVN